MPVCREKSARRTRAKGPTEEQAAPPRVRQPQLTLAVGPQRRPRLRRAVPEALAKELAIRAALAGLPAARLQQHRGAQPLQRLRRPEAQAGRVPTVRAVGLARAAR